MLILIPPSILNLAFTDTIREPMTLRLIWVPGDMHGLRDLFSAVGILRLVDRLCT